MFLEYFCKIQKIIMKPKKYLIFKKTTYKFISFLIILNSPYIYSSTLADDYKSQINFKKFDKVFFSNDTKFEDKDSVNNRFGSFFGIDYSLENKSFSDLALPFTSRDIRKIYEYKLIQMSIKENRKLKDVFFKDKL